MPKQKAPGPDDFIGAFFSQCWSIIKADCMDDVQQFYSKNQHGLYFLNQALVVLIPKKPNVEKIIEFRPIHSSAKLISKILANRLATELKKIISYSQNAFIKKWCIHDNIMYVQQLIKDLHSKKVSNLFIKLDIFKAFDTVNWSYLLDIMSFWGVWPKMERLGCFHLGNILFSLSSKWWIGTKNSPLMRG